MPISEQINTLVDSCSASDPPDIRDRGYYVFTGDEFATFVNAMLTQCAQFTDPVTANLMLKHFGAENASTD